jgi:membrane dipeptidase
MTWFDAHLDLACLAVNGRDMLASLDEINGPHARRPVGVWPPAAVTLDSLRAAGVTRVLATIFTETDGKDADGYPAGDAEAAHEAGLRQLRVYHNWVHDAGVRLTDFADDAGDLTGAVDDAGGGSRAYQAVTRAHAEAAIQMGILIENADPIRSPDELPWWVERGVVAVGMAWWTPSRYAGGNGTDTGLTDLGRALARAMDDLGVIHDLSHLSQRATDELLEATGRTVIASHSNCRALLGGTDNEAWQRHLADETIIEIGRRGGVIGLNLVRNFLRWTPGATPETLGRPSIDETIAHVERVCELTGSREHVGLGSDMDGGISADDLPEGIDTPGDLHTLSDALRARGWSDEEIAGFERGNWLRVLRGRGAA